MFIVPKTLHVAQITLLTVGLNVMKCIFFSCENRCFFFYTLFIFIPVSCIGPVSDRYLKFFFSVQKPNYGINEILNFIIGFLRMIIFLIFQRSDKILNRICHKKLICMYICIHISLTCS